MNAYLKGEQTPSKVPAPLHQPLNKRLIPTMMTQATAVKPATSAYERTLITIEFAPSVSKEETEFTHEHPKFVFGNHVSLVNEYPSIDYTVRAIELVESKTPSGRLQAQPYWKYKISNGEVCHWRDESALTLFHQQSSDTCSTCQYFNNYQDSRGCGWCNLFDRSAKAFHIKTNNCVLNSQEEAFPTEVVEDELDKPYSEYEVGSIVKVIDADEDHQEWAVFEIIDRKHNKNLYRSTDSYLNEPEWYFRLGSKDNTTSISSLLWVREDEICFSEQSHNICTKEIF